MAKQYISVSVETANLVLLKHAEVVYREHHPELHLIPLSKSKVIYEVLKFYLDKTKFKVDQ